LTQHGKADQSEKNGIHRRGTKYLARHSRNRVDSP
jgi:hypothetical protein